MKFTKKTALILSSVIFISAFNGVSYADKNTLENASINISSSNGKKYTTTANLNLRSGNTTSDSVVTTIPKGSSATHLGTTDNGWYKLDYNGKTGYAHQAYLTEGYSRASSSETTGASGEAYTTNVNLNLRSGDSTSSSVITTMPKGSLVKHIGTSSNGWFKLDFGGRVGYANKQYLAKGHSGGNSSVTVESSGEGYTTNVNLNLRSGDSTSNSIVTTMPKGSLVKHIGTSSNGWFKLDFGGKIGYANKQHLTKGNSGGNGSVTTGSSSQRYHTTANLNLRSGNSASKSLVTTIPKGKEVTVLNNSNGWAEVQYGNYKGFVNFKYLQKGHISSPAPNRGKADKSTTNISAARQKLVDVSLELVNKVPYFWGGKSYVTGWNPKWNTSQKVTASGNSKTGKYIPFGLDCSGFIDWAYRTAGLGKQFSTGGTSHQWDKTYAISQSEALPGDLVFKGSTGEYRVNHIGIYIGNNSKGEALVVHSSYSHGGVVLTTIKQAGLSKFRRAKNIF